MTERIVNPATGLCDDVCCVVYCPTCWRVLYPTWARMCGCAEDDSMPDGVGEPDAEDSPCDSP